MTDEQQTEVQVQPEEASGENQAEQTSGPTKAQVIAQILNEPDIEFVDWQSLMGEGVVVRLHIRRVRFRKRLEFSDLGIHFPNELIQKKYQDIFRLGMKNLLPKKYLDRIEQIEYKARKLLAFYSFETVWGPFIPATAYGKWREAIRELEDAYYTVRDAILEDYPALKKQILQDYVTAAHNSYRIMNRVDPQALSERERQKEIYYLASVRRKIRTMLPTTDDITKTFGFTVVPTYIDLPRLAGDPAGSALPVAPGSQLEKRTIEGVEASEQTELRWLQAGTKQRQAMMQAMNEDVVRQARAKKEERIDEFLTKITSEVRGLLYEATTNVLASMRKNDTLPPRSVVQLKNLVQTLNRLNFYEDRDVERSMKLIDSLIDVPREDRDIALIEQHLQEIAVVMRSTLLPLEYEFREDREDANEKELEKRELAGIPRRPSTKEVREARMSLGFEIPVWDQEREEREDEGRLAVAVPEDEREERTW